MISYMPPSPSASSVNRIEDALELLNDNSSISYTYKYILLSDEFVVIISEQCDDIQSLKILLKQYEKEYALLLLKYNVGILTNDEKKMNRFRKMIFLNNQKQINRSVRYRSKTLSTMRMIKQHSSLKFIILNSISQLEDEIDYDVKSNSHLLHSNVNHHHHDEKKLFSFADDYHDKSTMVPKHNNTTTNNNNHNNNINNNNNNNPTTIFPSAKRRVSDATLTYEGLPPNTVLPLDVSNKKLKWAASQVHDINSPINWCMFGFASQKMKHTRSVSAFGITSNSQIKKQKLIYLKSGENGVEELRSLLPADQIVYVLANIEMGHKIKHHKIVLLVWRGENVNAINNHLILLKQQISNVFQPIHFDYTPSSRESVTMNHIVQLLQIYVHSDEITIRLIKMKAEKRENDSVIQVETESPILVYADVNMSISDFSNQLVINDFILTENEKENCSLLIVKEDTQKTQRYGHSNGIIQRININSNESLASHHIINGITLFVDLTAIFNEGDTIKLDANHLPIAQIRVQEIVNIMKQQQTNFIASSQSEPLLDLNVITPTSIPKPPHAPIINIKITAKPRKNFKVVKPPTPLPVMDVKEDVITEEVEEDDDEIDHEDNNNAMIIDEATRKYEIDLDQIYILEYSIGVGRSAVVHHGLLDTAEIALKIFRYNRLSDKIKLDFQKEVNTLRSITQHENICMFVGASFNPSRLAIVTEWVPRGSLHNLLMDIDNVKIDTYGELKMALDCAQGMAHLHHHSIIHRDLKSHNLLVDENWRVKVTDFGLARWINNDDQAFTECGTSGWVAPEILDPPEEGYNKLVDVFSFGIVCWEIVSRSSSNPLTGLPSLKYYRAIRDGRMPEIPQTCHDGFRQLIQECWSFNAESRPDFDEIVVRLQSMIDNL